MNRYILIRRLKGPAILLLIGTIALLHQAGLASWHLFVPLLFIVLGVLLLAERAVLATMDDPSQYGGMYPGQGAGPYPGQPWGQYGSTPNPQAGVPSAAGSSIVQAATQSFGPGSDQGPQGGQS